MKESVAVLYASNAKALSDQDTASLELINLAATCPDTYNCNKLELIVDVVANLNRFRKARMQFDIELHDLQCQYQETRNKF